MFRALNKEEIKEFREYAIQEHKAGDLIRNDIHHPIIVLQSMIIDEKAGIKSNLEM